MSHHSPSPRALAATVAVAALVLAGSAAGQAATAAPSVTAPVVIDEVYGGGGNSGAPVDRDFVELYNPGAQVVDLSGWAIQYASAAGTSWQVTTLPAGTGIEPGGHLLVGQGVAGASGSPIEPDVSGTTLMGAAAGKVALTATATALAGCGADCSAVAAVVDFVGYGTTANDYAGAGPALGASNALSVARSAAHANTADNAADFTAGAPTPQAGGGTDPEPDPDPVEATIAEIQGTGAASPLAGNRVVTRGVVTASYPTGGLNGYVVQTPGTGGGDPSARTASDALFVFSRSTVGAVEIGDHVEVVGEVSEYFGLTELTVAAADDLTVLTEPAAPVVPTAVSWPATQDAREVFESMLIQPAGAYTVTNTFSTNRFGEVGLAFGDEPLHQPTDRALPGSADAAAIAADNAARAVALDDGSSTDFLTAAASSQTPAYVSQIEPVVVGASVAFDAPLILDWRNSAWKFTPTSQVVGDGSGDDPVTFSPVRTAAPEDVGGDVSVASFNVLNYFTTLGAANPACEPFVDRTGDGVTVDEGCDQRGAWDPEDLARQQEKIVSAINALDASVIGLMEIENSARLGEEPDEATATLVAALNAAAGEDTWAYVPSSPELPAASEQDVITSAIIYQPDEVTRSGPSRALGTQSGADQAFGNAREPLAQVFRPADGGERFLFVVNHFKSKGSAGPWPGDRDAGDGQSLSNESRVRQATALRDWVAGIRGDVDSVVLAGDFNSYGQEDPLRLLYDAGYVDAEQSLGIDSSSYSFSGLSGSLDHILLSGPARERATGGDVWNINSGEVVALEYSRYNYHGTLFHAADPYRSSDHDPVLVGLEAGTDERTATRTTLVAVPPLHINRLLPATLVAVVSTDDRTRPAGEVQFFEGDELIGSTAVTRAGIAKLRLPSVIARGTHSYTAVFVPADPEAQRGSTSKAVKVIAVR
ncbi:ExeM/NucH family extracellular endonuclease [Microbacterium terricola]|uniref:LTD domain-containing protein n=1 Tax=Microbacterium terricola TaxID=344163 RepID=A0ABM8DYP6_9MICO|nr:ExeM/NucH family extracellular endonuclease [Microbacterium terricola]UYK41491.1 ExeM/NucH family extracellular endonuclease [Microbacterium terricola]BDV30719.1 hypothetical protein Microterr_13790 [Microbacterium terricola]